VAFDGEDAVLLDEDTARSLRIAEGEPARVLEL
jgi:hypothetical protein